MTPKERISTVRRWLWVAKWYICTESIGRRRRENAYPTLYGILWVFRTLLEKVKKKGRLLCLNLAVYRRITATSHRISTEITQRAPRILGFFSSHNVYYVKKTILLDKHRKGCYTSYADSHRGVLEVGALWDAQRYWENTGRYSEIDWQCVCVPAVCMWVRKSGCIS